MDSPGICWISNGISKSSSIDLVPRFILRTLNFAYEELSVHSNNDCIQRRSGYSQTTPAPTPSPRPARSAQVQQRPSAGFDLAEYGVAFQADPRLIIMMVCARGRRL